MDQQKQLLIFKSDTGQVEVQVEGDTVWLSLQQMAELFGRDKSVISRHLKNIFTSNELDPESTVAKNATVQTEGVRDVTRQIEYYNLDAIISVGYRVNSGRATRFRQWATRILREHLTKGYTLYQQRFEQNAAELEAALTLIKKTAASQSIDSDQGRGLVDVIAKYTSTFLWLQKYDEGLLTKPSGCPGGTLSNYAEARTSIDQLKKDLMARGEATILFGRERDDNFIAILGNLEQTIFGEPAYPTIEAKAAHLLYFIIKNHPFSDGNKRIGSYLFVDFLAKNNRLQRNGEPVINDVGLAALALLVAESDPKSKNIMISLVENMLA